MKKHTILCIAILILLSGISCSEDKNGDENADEDTTANFTYDPCVVNGGTCCGIIGRFKVRPGKTYVYSETTSIINPTITWEVVSGSISLVSAQGTTAVFKFNSDFTTGTIRSRAVNSSIPELCESILDISKE